MPDAALVPGALGPEQRRRALRALGEEEFDLLVIGAGATGSGAALDAASRGLRVAMVEKSDLAAGTSSRSSKLVHGGLRYLEQLRFGLVREALRERELLLTQLAPHLVRPVSYLYPLQGGPWERRYVGTGIALYDVLGGGWGAMPRHQHLSHEESLALAPGLLPAALTGGIRYYDGLMDDARLNVAIARTAAEYGAVVTTGTPVVALLRRGERIAGAVVHDEETDDRIYIRAKAVLGCVGVWTDGLYALTGEDGPSPLPVRASKGVHLLVPGSAIDSDTGILLRTPRSVLFVTPWGSNWLVGTTDTPWDGELDEPSVTAEDVDYLIHQANTVLRRPLTRADVLATYAGLRPLVDRSQSNDTTRISREHVVTELAPGLTAIAGGKWTTYRVMAQDAVRTAMEGTGVPLKRSRTRRIELAGARAYPSVVQSTPALAEELGLSRADGEAIAEWYGGQSYEVLALMREDPQLLAPLAGAPEYRAAEVVHACLYDGARHLSDVLDRRLRIALTGAVPMETARDVARHMARALCWDDVRRERELSMYLRRAATAAAWAEEVAEPLAARSPARAAAVSS